jgi:hypothetical protein
MAGELKDDQFMLTLLTALVKREGGEIRIPEETMIKVTTTDIVTLGWDPETSEIVLMTTPLIMVPGGMTYEN